MVRLNSARLYFFYFSIADSTRLFFGDISLKVFKRAELLLEGDMKNIPADIRL